MLLNYVGVKLYYNDAFCSEIVDFSSTGEIKFFEFGPFPMTSDAMQALLIAWTLKSAQISPRFFEACSLTKDSDTFMIRLQIGQNYVMSFSYCNFDYLAYMKNQLKFYRKKTFHLLN